MDWRNLLSLTKEERLIIYVDTRDAVPDAVDGKAFSLKYKLALWEADIKKKGGNPGRHLGNSDFSSLPDTEDQNDSAEDSSSSDDGLRAIREKILALKEDLESQRKVTPPAPLKRTSFLLVS